MNNKLKDKQTVDIIRLQTMVCRCLELIKKLKHHNTRVEELGRFISEEDLEYIKKQHTTTIHLGIEKELSLYTKASISNMNMFELSKHVSRVKAYLSNLHSMELETEIGTSMLEGVVQ